MLKMIAIYLRIQSNIPIILMGETCRRKTLLIKFLAKIANVHLHFIDVHYGFGSGDLRNIIKKDQEQWILLDDINTSPDIGWLNELVCNHTLDSMKIPEDIKIIVTYGRRKLSDEEQEELFGSDELGKYKYVWSFESLSDLDEQQYIVEMVNQVKDKAIVSLQDVLRCLKIFEWLTKQYVDDDSIVQSFLILVGIVLNQGLKENLFVLFMFIITTTPIVLVGKLDTSKTLSFHIIRDISLTTKRSLKKIT
ncbi:hypothetical protein RFI_31905 [Reticulomyxa filosa]|uniref:ATPase dynein-related AAA domain-containing protein n=1 Tax=Reticulomyxa filosa TaxID=46433 RepID=X6LWI2_RETFI|nr:hypothetical protein RFI_31905 [Reticulomyxa filosa]|eukprot:ETO05492.1 hypothetical protein RFI_31905 [Reticulomyxa filosa]